MLNDLRVVGRFRSMLDPEVQDPAIVFHASHIGIYVIVRYDNRGWTGVTLWAGNLSELHDREQWYTIRLDDLAVPTYDMALEDFRCAFRRYQSLQSLTLEELNHESIT